MKHIIKIENFKLSKLNKSYENIQEKLIPGTHVKILYCNYEETTFGFNVNDIYTIITTDNTTFPYKIIKFNSNDNIDNIDSIWVKQDQIRKALPHEIKAAKYNL